MGLAIHHSRTKLVQNDLDFHLDSPLPRGKLDPTLTALVRHRRGTRQGQVSEPNAAGWSSLMVNQSVRTLSHS